MENQLVPLHTRGPVVRTDIPGWGVDADPQNDATYPMRDRQAADARAMTWDRPAQQPADVEVLQSVEHNRLPAVFGASVPPSGLSGAIRRKAFAYSESQMAHWLLLMLADRVNVAEGIVADLSAGRAPNLIAERGLGAEWRHNRPVMVRKMAVGAGAGLAAAGLGYLLLRSLRRPAPEAGPASSQPSRA